MSRHCTVQDWHLIGRSGPDPIKIFFSFRVHFVVSDRLKKLTIHKITLNKQNIYFYSGLFIEKQLFFNVCLS